MGPRTVGRRERGFPPTDCPWRMVAAWWSHCSSAGPRARLFVHVVCISRRVRSLVQATVCIRTHSHTYASFTREKLARVRYICLSSGFLLHLSPFAYLMLFFGPRSLSPFSKSRFSSKILSTFYQRLRTRSNGTFGMRKQPVDCLIPVAPKCRSTIYMQCSSLVALS